MTGDVMLEIIGLAFIFVGAVVQTFFIFRFATRRWWATMLGRAVMVLAVAVWLLLWVSLADLVVGVPMWVEVAIVGLITVGIVWKTVVLFSADRDQTQPTENQRPNV